MASWPKTADGQHFMAEGKILIPVDPTGSAVIMVKPDTDAVGAGFTAVEVGPPGPPPTLDETVNFTALAPADPTADSASLTVLTPATSTTAGHYRLNLALHTGADGADGDTVLTPDDYSETPVAGQVLAVAPGGEDFELVTPKIGGRHSPVTLSNTAPGNAKSTIGVIAIAQGTYPFDYRVEVEAQTIVTGTGDNVSVNLVARLGDENGGNIIGIGFGVGGVVDRLVLSGGPPPNSPASWDVIPAGAGATVYLRCEQQEGSDTYTTSADTTWFNVKVTPVP